ncbi:MAG: hypothetical protein GEV12_21990 [Micromonosporaceae bacterium]|nr:hypothetical protein [Micromonosporaceae bacterium]
MVLTVRLEHFRLAAYHGWLQASTGGEVVARTTVGWTKSPKLHRLTIRGIGRTSGPGRGRRG